LGGKLLLSIDLDGGDTVDVHVVVVGRVARPKQAGLYVRPVEGHMGVEELDARCGVVPSRMPLDVEAHFHSEDDARKAISVLRQCGEGRFPCEARLAEGQSVRILVSHPQGTMGLADGVIHQSLLVDKRRAYVVRRPGFRDAVEHDHTQEVLWLLPS
jgi:hypothetical protein